MTENSTLHRADVFQYRKSGKLAAIYRDPHLEKYTVLDLDESMSRLLKVRSIARVQWSAIDQTPFKLESVYTKTAKSSSEVYTEHKFLRILTKADLNLRNWQPSKPLSELSISPSMFITKEEEVWAGKEDGTIFGGIIVCAIALASWYWAFNANWFWLPTILAPIFTYFAARYPWESSKPARPERLSALRKRKRSILENAESRIKRAKGEFSKILESFENWKTLSPIDFEAALVLRMEKEGFDISMTRTSGDGGVDLEGEDPHGCPVIIQAKQYKKPVGVAVIREMVGVREGRKNAPRTMVYSLVGFTRGARVFADEHGIELRDIRSEFLGLN